MHFQIVLLLLLHSKFYKRERNGFWVFLYAQSEKISYVHQSPQLNLCILQDIEGDGDATMGEEAANAMLENQDRGSQQAATSKKSGDQQPQSQQQQPSSPEEVKKQQNQDLAKDGI